MTASSDINSIVKIKKIKQALPELGTRSPINTTRGGGELIVAEAQGIVSPITREILTTEVVRVYQNNDNTSANWVDEERALTYTDTDANGKVFTTDVIIWPV